MSRCPAEAELERYLIREGDANELSTLDSHVDSCSDCRAWLSEARADDALLPGVRAAFGDRDPRVAANGQVASSSADGREFADRLTADRRGPAALPERIAGYRIQSVLGEGGMGVVYLAEQQSPRREVALKVVRGQQRIDSQRLRLFRREADALARLRHTGIAAIHEAGCTEEGQHFFVMELVRGVPLDAWARTAGRSLRARVDLFCRVCDAISYAHQRGVIHRDLKPSNILIVEDAVEGTGIRGLPGASHDPSAPRSSNLSVPQSLASQPKVLDFGLARITDTDALSSDVPATLVTEVGKIQGTLAYMSPEQARGNTDEIDVRSDVYSLGVILYEMLTGTRPYSVSRTQLPDAIRVICETPPRRPGAIVRGLRGDLETIILKALEKSPDRRYSGVAALRDDLQRYLNQQPIQARPPSTAYQLRKLVARHRLATALIATLFATVCGFAAWATLQYRSAERLRVAAQQGETRAAAKAATAEEIQRFLQGILVSVDPDEARGRDTEILQELLRNAADRVEHELVEQPEVAAAIRLTIGNTYANLGDFERAESQLRAAAELRKAVFGAGTLPVAEALVDLGRVLRIREQCEEGESILRRALNIRQTHLGSEHIQVAEVLNNLGTLLTACNRTADAVPLFEQAIAIHALVRSDADAELAIARSNLGLCYFRLGRLDDAERELRAAVEVRRRLNPEGDATTAVTLSNLGSLLIHFKQDREAAVEVQREVCEIRRRILPADHPDLIDSLENLAATLVALDRGVEAMPVYHEAIDRQRALLERRRAASDAELTRAAEQDLGLLEFEVGKRLLEFGLYADAEPHLRFAAVPLHAESAGSDVLRARIALSYGQCLVGLGLPGDAEPWLLDAYAAFDSQSRTTEAAAAARTLVELYDAGDRPEAAAPFRAAAKLADR